MLRELLATEGVAEHCEIRSSPMGFLALHGGLEATTFEIAREAATRSAVSLYAVVQPDTLHWHVPSHKYAAHQSPALASFCDTVRIACSLHGYGGVRDSDQRWTTVLLGGSNRNAARALAAALDRAFEGYYQFLWKLDDIPPAYRGVHADNPVNRTRDGGVQIELPPRIRGNSPVWDGAPRNLRGFVEHTELLVATLAEFATTYNE